MLLMSILILLFAELDAAVSAVPVAVADDDEVIINIAADDISILRKLLRN